MELKAKDLRIGNLIWSGKSNDSTKEQPFGHWHKVISIGNDDQKFEQIESETEESFEWIFKDNWTGIPLTEDILLKCGFNKHHACMVLPLLTACCLIYAIKKREFFMDFNGIDVEYNLQYVHQLQNLYFALTNKELEIEL